MCVYEIKQHKHTMYVGTMYIHVYIYIYMCCIYSKQRKAHLLHQLLEPKIGIIL